MFSNYKPTWMVEAVYKITPAQLKKLGIKAVLTDLDNTLIAWNNPDGTEELFTWILEMRNAGIPVVVVSNNNSERVARAVKKFELLYVARALKPLPVGINKAKKMLDLADEEIIMIGDQIMTDIRGANSAGIRSVLVKPIIETDSWKTKFNRFWERKIMSYLVKKHPDMDWRGGIE
ncbi:MULTISPECIES: YqeG family HAD IIIA-type phosphatase [Enterococcus]|uniref:HAD family hydrolase n=1 Tax=Enterococcus mundtii TaxID=53346 RepID=A0A1A6G8R1_ENTMU|nr:MULTISPECIES: YqeG family HAD IIIA-type phosphatase [Enterococcus]MBE6172441.1 YqeG family HAD IIIA-type phosphatase [Enterococcus faecium]GEN16864.1 haloacid dehalogenase [Ligilactobacillus acidipiscis]AUB52182.1 HAD family hydrolase [Enterococcus mundtii]AZP92474.1 YqeG family HAD IIIA-type phosphatase [Enterococcus mundtii]EOH60995.1 HAD phosphatase, family IIIA [Enterococcus mundtii ATCC 882]